MVPCMFTLYNQTLGHKHTNVVMFKLSLQYKEVTLAYNVSCVRLLMSEARL